MSNGDPQPYQCHQKTRYFDPQTHSFIWADDEFEEVPLAVDVPSALVAVSPSLLVVAIVISVDCPIDMMPLSEAIILGPALSSVR
jgi:hypothetical protein